MLARTAECSRGRAGRTGATGGERADADPQRLPSCHRSNGRSATAPATPVSHRPLKLLAVLAALVAAVAVGAVVAGATRGPTALEGADLHALGLGRPAADGGPAGRLALTGAWVMAIDRDDVGRRDGWQGGGFDGERVTVPHVANAGHVTGAAGLRAFKGSIAWYRTTLTAPVTGSYALRFESVHHRASVWLDGHLLGQHTGAYLPFEFHLRLRDGVRHTLVVRADYRSPTEMKRDGWHRAWFNWGGINREVTLRPLERSTLEDPSLQTTLVGPPTRALVDVSVDVRNRASRTRDLQVAGTLHRDGARIPVRFPRVHLAPGQVRRVRGRAVVARPALWQPGSPALYQLHLEVGGEGVYDQAVGLRELRRVGSTLLLNGRRLRLHGASLHEDDIRSGDALRPAEMDAIVRELHAVGANATRAQHALSPALLERLDRAGILVWQGVGPVDAPGAWTSQSPYRQRLARARVRTTVRQERLHPSVVAWNLVNEVAGNGHDDTQVAYVRDMARWLHRNDPDRLVALDIWGTHPPTTPGDIYRDVDAVALTNYAGWYDGATLGKAQIAALIKDTALTFTRTFPDKVKIISEFGAEANDENPRNAPGGYGFQAWLLRRHIATYRAMPQLSGMLVWSLRDFALTPSFAGGSISRIVPGIKLVRGINQKGLFDVHGRPKPSVEAVRKAYESLR